MIKNIKVHLKFGRIRHTLFTCNHIADLIGMQNCDYMLFKRTDKCT